MKTICGALCFAGFLILSAPGLAASHLLADQAFDPKTLLPPPPTDGSPAARAELAELDRIQAGRTPDALARAVSDDETENPTAFQAVIGSGFDLKALPATARLLAEVMDEQRHEANVAKKFFHRNRPWIAEPDLKTCAVRGPAQTSYPSGHATMGYAVGVVLASLMPGKAQAILARASDFAENRLVCAMHYRRDIVAGQVLGTAVAVALMGNPQFRTEFDAAEQELSAAKLAP